MGRLAIGTRVGAILSATTEKIYFLGWGTYDGDFIPPEFEEDLEKIMKDLIEMYPDKTEEEVRAEVLKSSLGKNPRITLDSGGVVWGMQVWWGPEEVLKSDFFDDREIVNVTLDEVAYE